jgi:hypothetical protein
MEELMTFPITDPILQFTLLLAVSLIVQLTVERLHLPGLIGLLLIGMLLGPGGANVLAREPMLDLLGSIGLVYVMFMAGTEIDFSTLRTHPRETVLFGLGSFVFSLIPAMGVALLMGWGWGWGWARGPAAWNRDQFAHTAGLPGCRKTWPGSTSLRGCSHRRHTDYRHTRTGAAGRCHSGPFGRNGGTSVGIAHSPRAAGGCCGYLLSGGAENEPLDDVAQLYLRRRRRSTSWQFCSSSRPSPS